MEKYGWDRPTEFRAAFPVRVLQAAEKQISRDWVEAFIEGRASVGTPVEESEEDTEVLKGSLLNVALLLESAARLSEAGVAFSDVISHSQDPTDRYLAHFGLARLALALGEGKELLQQVRRGVGEGAQLGPITHAHALTEGALLLCTGSHPEAQGLLEQAFEAARAVKDSGAFALVCLAREHFFARPAGKRTRILGHLMQPERFPLAVESASWLLAWLLAQPEPSGEERRFLSKLLRAAPGAFERLLLRSEDVVMLRNSVSYLETLGPAKQERVVAHLESLNDEELRTRLARRAQGGLQQESMLRVFSFSGIRLYRDDESLHLTRKKPLLLLLYLLYRDGPVGEESLLELFWPGDEQKGRATLRTTLSYLRKLVCPDGRFDPLPRQASGLTLSPELPLWFDYREFQQFVRRGRGLEASAPLEGAESYRQAVRLYRGPFLENVFEDWALEAREQAERDYEDCLSFLCSVSVKAKNWAQAYEFASRGLRKDPLSHSFCEMTMRALIGLSRQRDALSVFEQSEQTLRRELDTEPSIEMIRLREMAKLGL